MFRGSLFVALCAICLTSASAKADGWSEFSTRCLAAVEAGNAPNSDGLINGKAVALVDGATLSDLEPDARVFHDNDRTFELALPPGDERCILLTTGIDPNYEAFRAWGYAGVKTGALIEEKGGIIGDAFVTQSAPYLRIAGIYDKRTNIAIYAVSIAGK